MIRNLLIKASTFLDRKLYRKRNFVIVSNNCWGAETYRRLGMEYNTPFVGLFFFGPDYVKLLSRFDYYMNCELKFTDKSKWSEDVPPYPIGLLDDVEIQFLHYTSREIAMEKWNRRLQRMKTVTDKDNYFFEISERDKTDKDVLETFHQLPFKNKISFGHSSIQLPTHIEISESDKTGLESPDGLTLYKLAFKYVDVLHWINAGKIATGFYSRLKCRLRVI